ncbi:MAG TPA: helix-turn-helix domain-containing protein [Actinomycetes bacterium]|nr:helix-turn-helix domain-containing protein [Actinomycetes bacterium]
MGTLQVLMAYAPASAAGLFRGAPGARLALFAGASITQVDLDRATEAWEDAQQSILAGNTYTDDGFALVPVGASGVVYLGAQPGRGINTALVDQVAHLLAAALEPRTVERLTGPAVVDIEATPAPAFERERLLLLLNRHEWNIARVARILGVYRPTVYKQLRRLGIERRRVSKK